MSFNFEKAITDAKKDLNNNKLALVLLGSSGNGKSYAQGTFGCKTLYLYASGESHGPKSAASVGGANIVPVCIDRDGEKALTADESYQRLLDILNNVDKKHGFGAISIDGASEIETIIRNTTQFKQKAKTTFDEGPVTLSLFRPILMQLKTLQRDQGVHFCMTCGLNVRDVGDTGEIIESTPALHGFQVATGLIQQFDDVMVIGRMQKSEKVGYRLQLLAGVTKTTKDFKTQEVRKTVNFSPRLTGVDITALPGTMEADLSKLITMKAGGK
jgi:hypothetical protein